ncbi:unnamed protein product [Cylicostephanus goldi]|uniref:Uncharacterized protein n=1 Tax=Cylicostephanus goldi TaxID=71465 RepID=A0A3P6TPZ1_CYLGO|nr:unnamed protein product [Cylicostephanus goldi]
MKRRQEHSLSDLIFSFCCGYPIWSVDPVDNSFVCSIGRVVPPTPGGTREPSTTGEPDRPPVDDSDHAHESASERLFKPSSECELFVGDVKTASDIKLSHSDSSIYG